MQIHELNNYSGSLGDAYLAADNGSDTGKMKTTALTDPLNARIDNIIAGPAPSAAEIVDARLGADGVTYPSLGAAIRDQVTDLKSDITNIQNYKLEFTGRVIDVNGNDDNQNIETDSSVVVIGRNLLDGSALKRNKIRNNSDIEVDDGSSYYDVFIPVKPGETLTTNFKVERVYQYSLDKTLIQRLGVNNTIININNVTHWIKIQIATNNITSTPMIVAGNNIGDYEAFKSNNNKKAYNPMRVYSNNGDEITIKCDMKRTFVSQIENTDNIPTSKVVFGLNSRIETIEEIVQPIDVPTIGTYPYWEIDEATNEYSCPIGQATQSVAGLSYKSVLSSYFDIYINTDYSNGYKVVKKSLGMDSGSNPTDQLANEVFYYEFIPKQYNRTVLLSAGMNACELSGIFGVAYFIKALMEHTEDGMKALYDTTRFIVLPCMCPSSLNKSPIGYLNNNNVRINKNFDYDGSWLEIKEQYPTTPMGAYPDSEVETKFLKTWLNQYNGADLWIDCHSDTGTTDGVYTRMMAQAIVSDNDTMGVLNSSFAVMGDYYKAKGYIPSEDNPLTAVWVARKWDYPKQLYSLNICGIPSIMIEQYICSTTYGSDGQTNNDSYGIKNYMSLLRWYCLNILKD